MNKLMYLVLGIVVVFIILVFTGNKSVHHEITINAAPEKIWKALIETDD